MADNNNQGQLVLAQNQYAYIQDITKGPVQVYCGPVSTPMSNSDRPVLYNPNTGAFDSVSVNSSIRQNALVPEGHYIVLDNPSVNHGDDKGLKHPPVGRATIAADLQIGRKIVIPGPTSFALWPGQDAKTIPGHKLRSNQYLVVRVYNADQANENGIDNRVSEDLTETKPLVNGQLFVIKGTSIPFFIPKSGFEVLQEDGEYVREALTLERLEYCILLDESGNKRYEEGPSVVFPTASEKFVRKDGSIKFKAIELNDQMGLYVKVIADYQDAKGKEYKAGDELFITGAEQRIYYPRPEHALIEYRDPENNFTRQKYYSVAIPKGEGRYVLDKTKGEIAMQKGPKMFLPDPRTETLVRRILDKRTVAMWYPGNTEAVLFNDALRNANIGSGYATDTLGVGSVEAMSGRGINRATSNSKSLAPTSVTDQGNDRMTRSGVYTQPPSLTLSTKYDGVPSIGIWTGYAVQVVNKNGDRRVVLGPTTILLEYDETLEVLTLSTGKPKTTETLKHDVYLRYENNLVSDIVNIVTKDNVDMSLKVSYRVNFDKQYKEKWFSIENYVKFLTDHTRSLIKGAAKELNIKEINDKATSLFRDVVLGKKEGNTPRTRAFPENGMVITDVEILGLLIQDGRIRELLKNSQQQTVETTIALATEEQNLTLQKKQIEVRSAVAKLNADHAIANEILTQERNKAQAETAALKLEADSENKRAIVESELELTKAKAEIAATNLVVEKNKTALDLQTEEKRVEFYKARFEAITPDLIQAMQTLGETDMATRLAEVVAPLAIQEHSGLSSTAERLFAGTPISTIFDNMKGKTVPTTGSVKPLPLPK